jgi:hypothetical protein
MAASTAATLGAMASGAADPARVVALSLTAAVSVVLEQDESSGMEHSAPMRSALGMEMMVFVTAITVGCCNESRPTVLFAGFRSLLRCSRALGRERQETGDFSPVSLVVHCPRAGLRTEVLQAGIGVALGRDDEVSPSQRAPVSRFTSNQSLALGASTFIFFVPSRHCGVRSRTQIAYADVVMTWRINVKACL